MPSFSALAAVAVVLTVGAISGCPEAGGPTAEHACNPVSEKWLKRAAAGYKAGDLDDAADSIQSGLKACPDGKDIRLIAARIALARLDFKGAAAALEGVTGSEAASLRARAYWYSDDLAHAADELSSALEDPDFKDPWAKPVRELAGTQGTGRHPFRLRDNAARLVDLKMPRDLGYALMVPVEIDGNATVALAVTGVPEVIIDAKSASSPRWVSMKFSSGDRSMEFQDVPALTQDLSSYTVNQVPIGALLGMNFLRRLHLTFDRRADQFIIRREEPPPPPAMTRVAVSYVRGGGMIVRGTARKEFELTAGLWVDTGSPWSLALPDPTWKKLGIDPTGLQTYGGLAHGKLTDVHVGGLDVGPVEAVQGIGGIDDKLSQLDIDTMGAMGIGFLTAMRVTLADNGRALWLETDEDTSAVLAPPVPTSGPMVGSVNTPTAPSSSATSKAPAGSAAPTVTAGIAPSSQPPPPPKPAPVVKPAASVKPAPVVKPAPAASAK